MNRRLLLTAYRLPLALVGMVLCLLILTACGGRESNVVTFVVFGDPAEKEAYDNLAAAFEAAHPEIELQMSHIPSQSEYRSRLAADFSSGSPTDVFLLNYRRFATFADQGGLEPLGPYLDASDLIARDDFYPPTIDSFVWDDQLWCVPQNMSSLVVYYNKDLFAAAGLETPANDWTRDDFLQAARALTLDTTGDGNIDQFGVGISPQIFRLAPFVWQDGGDIVDNRDQPTRLTLTDPIPLANFEWLVSLQTEEGVVPDAVSESAESSQSRFLNGTLGMIFNSRRGVPTYRTITNFEWDVVPLPQSDAPGGVLHSDAYCLAAQAPNKEAAWTFIEYANSVEGQTIVARSGRTVPSLIDVAESEAFLDPNLPPSNSRIYLDTIDTIGGVPIMTTWVGIEEVSSKEIERAFYGNVSVLEAAESAERLTQEFFDRANQNR